MAAQRAVAAPAGDAYLEGVHVDQEAEGEMSRSCGSGPGIYWSRAGIAWQSRMLHVGPGYP
jgi:hypothetical protein